MSVVNLKPISDLAKTGKTVLIVEIFDGKMINADTAYWYICSDKSLNGAYDGWRTKAGCAEYKPTHFAYTDKLNKR